MSALFNSHLAAFKIGEAAAASLLDRLQSFREEASMSSLHSSYHVP
jgi:hypothetical protein